RLAAHAGVQRDEPAARARRPVRLRRQRRAHRRADRRALLRRRHGPPRGGDAGARAPVGPPAGDDRAAAGMTALLEIAGLSAELPVEGEFRTVLHDVSLAIGEGEALGLVGESGSGKSMTARAVARLLPPGAKTAGAIRFDGADVPAGGGAL